MQQPTDDVIRKIQKLLALAQEGNNSEAEAQTAMAMAQKMLARYNLEFHQVQAAQVAGGTNAPEEKRERTPVHNRSAAYKWQRELYAAIAKANFCWHWIVELNTPNKYGTKKKMVRSKRHMLLGRESNLLVVRMMADYLFDTIERVLPYPHNERLSRSAVSWRAGCAARLIERIEADRNTSVQAAETASTGGPSMAITLRDVAEREEAGNYDARYGAGAWARKKASEAAWAAGAEERAAKRAAERAKEEAEWLEYLQNETPAQKAKRERLEEKERLAAARANERWSQKYYSERRREAAKVDHSAYRAGLVKGSDISLAKQAGGGTKAKELA